MNRGGATGMATIAMAIALFQSHWAVANETVAARHAGTKNKLGAKQQAPMAPGPRRRRRRGRGRGRGAKGVEWGEVWGGGFPSPSDYGVWGSVVSSPSGVRGGAPAQNEFGAF